MIQFHFKNDIGIMNQGKNMIIILIFIFILFYAFKIVFFLNNDFRIKFIKV